MDKKIDQKSYLQKYLSGSSEKKKKRKKPKGNGFKIIDDDVDYTKLRSLDDEELDLMNLGEDAPQIAGIIDERPEEIQKLEQFKISSKWKVINQDDGFNSKIKVTEIKQTIKEKRKENEIVFGKMYSDSEEDGNKDGSDLSPPRHKETNKSTHKNNTKVLKSDSDISPPRNSKNVDSLHKKVKIPSNVNDKYNNRKLNREQKISASDDSDHAPPRKHKSLKDKYKDKRKNGDSSPPRKPRRDSDVSPPRKRKGHKFKEKKPNSDESDLSPPRRNNRKNKTNSDSDLSPCRKSQNKNYNSDQSPPRKNKSESTKARKRSRWESDSKTLDGKKAGLQNSTQLQHENEAFRKREELAFTKLTDEVSGRNAHAVSRKAKRETSEDRRHQREKEENQKLLDEKYKVWNRGIKQIEAQEQRVRDYIHEASKPLARLRGDVDLERALKDEERDGDPMLDYIRDKKREMGELPPERPTFKGNFPLNRFNIRPGYRWDGVDRSNGYENKYFENQSKRKAQEEEAYKWSSADL